MKISIRTTILLLLCLLSPLLAGPGEDCRKLAEDHYQAGIEGRQADWIEFFLEQPREQYKRALENGVQGAELEFLWIASQRRAKQGVRYEFQRVDRVEDDNVKVYFKRYKEDGSFAGHPAPVIFHKENDEWKIYNVRY